MYNNNKFCMIIIILLNFIDNKIIKSTIPGAHPDNTHRDACQL